MLALIVLGGAVAAGTALGKKDGDTSAGATTPSMAAHTHIEVHMFTEEAAGQKATDHLEIKDFSFGVENPTTIGSATGGAGAGKIKFNEFTIKKTTDRSSPAFFKNCATGSHYASVVVEMRRVSDKNESDYVVFQKFEFETVFVTKIDWTGPGDEGPEESITFVYGKLGIHIIGAGTEDSASYSWDQVTNREDNA